jgi:hypothetical protein
MLGPYYSSWGQPHVCSYRAVPHDMKLVKRVAYSLDLSLSQRIVDIL